MSDNLRHTGEPDRSRVSLRQAHEVRYWTEKFGCTEDELRRAVAQAGSYASAVEQMLKSKAPSH